MQQNLKENIAEECGMQNLSTQETRSSITNPATVTMLIPDCGRKITFDNVDYRQEVHHMTELHQDN